MGHGKFLANGMAAGAGFGPWQVLAIVAVFFVPVFGDVLALALFLKWTAWR